MRVLGIDRDPDATSRVPVGHADPRLHLGGVLPGVELADPDASRSNHYITAVGRLAPGVSAEAAREDMAAIAKKHDIALIDDVGLPLRESLPLLVDKLNEYGLRGRIKVIASGKLITPADVAWAPCMGADFSVSARGFMFALGCIQALRCETNTCPVGVATQDPRRVRGLVVGDKAERVYQFQRNTVAGFNQLLAAMGLDTPEQLDPSFVTRRVDPTTIRTYDELYEWLEPGELRSLGVFQLGGFGSCAGHRLLSK